MNTQSLLRNQAIQAAKVRDWQSAIDINLQLLEQNQNDTGALNRLGLAYLQTDNKQKAKECFLKSLELDSSNTIAKKHLQNLKSNYTSTVPSFTRQYFIEEPGRTKTVELVRLAGKQVIESLSVGQSCELKPKNRFISVEMDNQYIGALPEDLSFRLAKLIERGNKYSCCIRSCNSSNHCSVYLKETYRSPQNSDYLSFPLSRTAINSASDIDESVLLLDEDIPMEILDTDSDMERSFDDLDEDSDFS